MCLSITNRTMTDWLQNQIRMIEAWREALAMRADIDLSMVTRVERHYQWLTGELAALEKGVPMSGQPVDARLY